MAMAVSTRKPGIAPLDRLVRRWRFDRNPLRRTTDRVETAVLALLLVVFLAGAPFAALAAGGWVHGLARQAQLAEEASRFQSTAVVLALTAPPAGGGDFMWQARARWKAPDGREVTGDVAVPAGTTAGEKIAVWTSFAGDLTTAPLLSSQVDGQAQFAEVAGVIAFAGILALAGALARWLLDRRRMAAWDADLHAAGPLTGQRG
jgi:hypothetical protein